MMEKLKLKLWLVCALVLLFGTAPAILGGDYIDPGQDSWTCPGAEMGFGSCLPPIPADFFGPGSDPFTGSVSLEGHGHGADTIVERQTQGSVPPPYPSSDLIDVEIVALSLKSVSPITVTYNGGQNPEDWDVEVGLSVTPVPITDMNAIKTHANGGVFTADLYVQPIFIFTKVDDPAQQRTLDTGLEGIGPLLFSTVNPYPWQHFPDGNDFNPSCPVPMELDTGDGCHISLMPVKPPVPHLKWSQPPIEKDPTLETPVYWGWDEISYNKDYNDPCGPWKIVADDFRCLGSMPITSVHWWGSHYGWEDPCEQPPASELPEAWQISIWSNVPAGLGAKTDVLFLTDTTGSMGGWIDNFKTAFSGILAAIDTSLPGMDIEYGVADYRNYTDGGNYQTYGVNLIQPFTSNTAAVQSAIIGLATGGGGDTPESHLKGMVNIANNWLTCSGALGFCGRADAQKVLIWAGDAHGHIAGDEPGSSGTPPPGYYPTLNATINALNAQGVLVFALNTVDCSGGINTPYGGLFGQTPLKQQADEITSATGGTLFCSVGTGGPSIEDAIVTSITGGNPYSYPEQLLWQIEVDANRVTVNQVGTDEFCGIYPYDVSYQYYLDLEPNEIFWQGQFREQTVDDIFWLSIVAIYPNDVNYVEFPWGWKTRPWSWMDDAVTFNLQSKPVVGTGGMELVVDYTREAGDPPTSWSGFRSLYVWGDTMYIGDMSYDLFGHYDGTTFTYDADLGGSCVYDYEVYDNNLYACAWIGKVHKSSDGTTWTTIRGSQGVHSWELEAFQGYLYVSTGADLERYDGSTFTLVWTEPNGYEIISMLNDGSDLIIGVGNEAGYSGSGGVGKVYSYDGIAVQLISGNMGDGVQALLESDSGALYAGGSNPGVVYKYLGGTSWTVISPTLGTAVLSLCEFEGDLYAGTMNEDSSGEVWRYDGGASWTLFGDDMDDQVCSLIVYEGCLYAGTAWNSGRLYRYCPVSITPIEDPIWGESYDVAFELDTDPNWIKWEQPFTGIRDWPHYEDEKSIATEVATTETVTKYIQPPDLSPNGVDVDATTIYDSVWSAQILADDFNCTTTGLITDIHIWGSWYHDYPLPGDVDFYLSIYSDNPVGPNGWSEPNEWLWDWYFMPGEFDVSIEDSNLEEGYYVPCEPYYEPFADTICYKYDFHIDPLYAFMQQGDPCNPVVYWLVVEAYPWGEPNEPPMDPIRFGWKTTDPCNHFKDDAVWTDDWGDSWNELRYPAGHPYEGNSIDLAFEITTEEEKTEFNIDRLVADDWFCDSNEPVSAAVWWGSYIGYHYQAGHEGPWMDLPVPPEYFWLTIWDDVPADSCDANSYSHPNDIIWEYDAHDYDEVLVGYDKHPENPDPNGGGREPVFRYSVRIPEDKWFYQEEPNNVYWFSVVAVYDANVPNVPAVSVVVDDMESYDTVINLIRDTWLDGFWNWTGSYVDLGIAPNDPVHGGTQSMVYSYNNWFDFGVGYYSEIEASTAALGVSSDWTSLGVNKLALWFYGDPNNDDGDTEQMYVGLEDSMAMYGQVDYANMSDVKEQEWHLWCIDLQDFVNAGGVDLTDVQTIYIGFGIRGSPIPGGSGVVYFDDITLYDECPSELSNYPWGWTNHEHVYNDDAVAGVWDEENGEWTWEELYDQTDESEDMSFILFTDILSTEPGCPCKGDVSDTTGFGPPDNIVDIGDLNYTLMAMFAIYTTGDPNFVFPITPIPPDLDCMNVSDTTGFGPPDDRVDIGDLNYTLMAMFAIYTTGDPNFVFPIPCLP